MATSERKKAAVRVNGLMGGAPRKPSKPERDALDKVRSRGRRSLAKVMSFWIDLIEEKYPSATMMDRLAAAKEIANRCGLPTRTESELIGERPLTPLVFRVEGGLDWPAPVAADAARADAH